MERRRFFDLLHFARSISTEDKVLRRLIFQTFQYGYTLGHEELVDSLKEN